MEKPKIYISIPYSISDLSYNFIIENIKKKYGNWSEITYFDRNKKQAYTKDLIEEADYLIIVHPLNKFKYNTESLPTGVKTELERFIKLGRDLDVYGIYSPVGTDAINVYHINFNDITYTNIELITGTTSGLYNELVTLWVDEEEDLKITNYDPDNDTFESDSEGNLYDTSALPLLIRKR